MACGDGGPEEYRTSDVAADVNNFFQAAHEASLQVEPKPLVISLHGKRPTIGEPSVIVSDGTRTAAPEGSLSRKLAGNIAARGTPTSSCQEPGSSLRLCGTVSVQGRVSNGATDACAEGPLTASGRFLHVEQDYDKIGTIAPFLERAVVDLLTRVP